MALPVVRGAVESEYELARRQKIKENSEMIKNLFGEQHKSAANDSPASSKKRVRSRSISPCGRIPAVRLPLRRNPKRNVHSTYATENENSGSEESEDDSVETKRLLVRWVGPLTKKKRTGSYSSYSDHELSDESDTTSTRKRKIYSPRCIRPASDFTEDELLLIASCTSEKHKDAEFGTTCHQCRQKTDDLKTICRNQSCTGVRGQFCGPCLKNRYGEYVKDALLDENWSCPPCRSICNCSFCMPKRGRRCTGQLIGVARQNGFKDVRSFLGD